MGKEQQQQERGGFPPPVGALSFLKRPEQFSLAISFLSLHPPALFSFHFSSSFLSSPPKTLRLFSAKKVRVRFVLARSLDNAYRKEALRAARSFGSDALFFPPREHARN